LGLKTASDDALWIRARADGFLIVTKDEDFNDMVVVRGFPPKVVWLQLGNCTTEKIEAALRSRQAEIEAFETDPNVGTFVLR
jgi:predicted nuclease of predicted toxin-antitoxin system